LGDVRTNGRIIIKRIYVIVSDLSGSVTGSTESSVSLRAET
jgi:hypothetical protein